MLNAGLVFWLFVSSSLRSFGLERSVVAYGLTAIAIFISISGFITMIRRDSITVQWANTGLRFDPEPDWSLTNHLTGLRVQDHSNASQLTRSRLDRRRDPSRGQRPCGHRVLQCWTHRGKSERG